MTAVEVSSTATEYLTRVRVVVGESHFVVDGFR